MPFQIASIKGSLELLHALGNALQRLPGISHADKEDPDTLLEGIHQLLSMAQQIENGNTAKPFSETDITQPGDYGLQLQTDLSSQASHHTDDSCLTIIQQITIAVTDWIMRNGGTLQTLEPVVDSLAQLSNQTQKPAELLDCVNSRNV